MSKHRCDSCGRRIRPSHHELQLRDPTTGQLIGRYHVAVGGKCKQAAAKYMGDPDSVLAADIIHPTRCGGDFGLCDAGIHDLETTVRGGR